MIIALVTAVLLIVAVVVTFSSRPPSVPHNDTKAPAPASHESGKSPAEALPPPL